MLSLGSPESSASPRVYRFAGVELDVERFQLRVDGRPSPCPRKSFELLLLLCLAPETVLSRQQLQDALWPGGQLISDEALTQAIFRTRAALGPYAGLIATVRGIGLRLDATVTSHDRNFHSGSVPVTVRVAEEGSKPSERNWQPVRIGFALLLALVIVYFALYTPTPVLLDEGYGLTAEDILNSQPDTADLLVEAFESEAHGERARGATLLEAVHRKDESTPIPAIFLALWANGTGEDKAATVWIEQARARVGESRELYVNLLLDYVAAELEGDPQQIIYQAGAVLDLRPDAWRMRMARAHLMEYSGMREGALREISQVHVDSLDHRKLALSVADRASMGDVAGAQAILDRIPAETAPATHAFLSGRVAWSRGDFDAAHTHFMAAVELGHGEGRMDIYRRCLIYAGAIEAMWGQDEQALSTLERARNVAGNRSQIDEADVAMLLAQLHFAANRLPEAYAELDRALALSPEMVTDGLGVLAQLLSMRLRPETPLVHKDTMPPEIDALWRSAEAVARGEADTARRALAEALNLGILDSRMADEARWLELKLGLPVSDEAIIDPPYPPLSRIVLRREIRQNLAANGLASGILRP